MKHTNNTHRQHIEGDTNRKRKSHFKQLNLKLDYVTYESFLEKMGLSGFQVQKDFFTHMVNNYDCRNSPIGICEDSMPSLMRIIRNMSFISTEILKRFLHKNSPDKYLDVLSEINSDLEKKYPVKKNVVKTD